MSDKLTKETKAVGVAPFAELEAMGGEAIARARSGLPLEFLIAMMEATTQATIAMISRKSVPRRPLPNARIRDALEWD